MLQQCLPPPRMPFWEKCGLVCLSVCYQLKSFKWRLRQSRERVKMQALLQRHKPTKAQAFFTPDALPGQLLPAVNIHLLLSTFPSYPPSRAHQASEEREAQLCWHKCSSPLQVNYGHGEDGRAGLRSLLRSPGGFPILLSVRQRLLRGSSWIFHGSGLLLGSFIHHYFYLIQLFLDAIHIQHEDYMHTRLSSKYATHKDSAM